MLLPINRTRKPRFSARFNLRTYKSWGKFRGQAFTSKIFRFAAP